MISITRVWERLFIGGRLDAERLVQANPLVITTVVSLCEEPLIRFASGINYLHFPITDDKSLAQGSFDTILDSIAENIRWGSLLVHCGSGLSRAPIMAAAWMDAAGYKNIDAALQEIAERRPFILPSEPLLISVRRHLR